MDKEQVLSILREHQAELQEAGILHLRLFGSVARGDNRPDSDVDLMADFDQSRRLSLFDVVGMEQRLSDLLHSEVQLSEAVTMRPVVKRYALRDVIDAF